MFKYFRKPLSYKEISEKSLTAKGILFNKNLPEINFNNLVRTPSDIAKRIIVLWELINAAREESTRVNTESILFLKEINLWSYLASTEQQFLENETKNEQEIIDFAWKKESLKVLYWSLGEIVELGKPIEDRELLKINNKVLKKYPNVFDFINYSKTRKINEIYKESDFYYRLHWSTKSNRRVECNVPPEYEYSVIYERDFAFRWLVDPKTSWSSITCDT